MTRPDRRRPWVPVVVTGVFVTGVLALMWWDQPPPAPPQPVEEEPTAIPPPGFLPWPDPPPVKKRPLPWIVRRVKPTPAEDAPADLRGGRLFVWTTEYDDAQTQERDHATPPLLLKLDGTKDREFARPAFTTPAEGRLSPDGKRIAYTGSVEPLGPFGRTQVFVRTLGRGVADDEPVCNGRVVGWSGDGRQVYVDDNRLPPPDCEHLAFRLDAATGERVPLPLPVSRRLLAVSPDGARLLTSHSEIVKWEEFTHYTIYRPDGVPLFPVEPPPGPFEFGPFSPDGRRILCQRWGVSNKTGAPVIPEPVAVFDLDTRVSTRLQIAGMANFGRVAACCWSPDGKRIAIGWHVDSDTLPPGKVRCHVTLADIDGRNATLVYTAAGRFIWSLDWY